SVDPKVPDGYELVPGQTLPKNVNIKATDTPIDIQVQKKGDNDKNKKPAQQTYQFIDKNGNKVVGTAVVKGNEGDHVPVSLKVPKGYHLRSEEHTSELQSRFDLVCRLLLEKKNSADYDQHQAGSVNET